MVYMKSNYVNPGAEYLLDVKVYRESHLVYVIFFGTNHLTGCDKMKTGYMEGNSKGRLLL